MIVLTRMLSKIKVIKKYNIFIYTRICMWSLSIFIVKQCGAMVKFIVFTSDVYNILL